MKPLRCPSTLTLHPLTALSSPVRISLDHTHAPAGFAVLDAIHVGLDQQNSPAGAFQEIFLGGRIGNIRAIKTRAFVFDDDLGFIAG